MSRENEQRSTAEKVVLAVSLTLLAGIVAGILYIALWPADQPASFRFERGEIRQASGSYYLDFQVFNDGDETGRKVRVKGRLGQEVDTTVFNHFPGHSEQKGVFIFRSYPAGAELQVESYQRP